MELVALVPLIALLGAAAVQVAIAAHTWGVARDAARAGARAALVDAPVRDAARRVLGASLARTADVRTRATDDGEQRVRVAVRVPVILPWVSGPRVHAEAVVER